MSVWGRLLFPTVEGHPDEPVVRREIPTTLQQIQQLPFHYLKFIEVRFPLIGNMAKADLPLLEMMWLNQHQWEGTSQESRERWGNLMVSIPAVDNSKPTDSLGSIFRVLHVNEVMVEINPMFQENLPSHLTLLRSYFDTQIQLSRMSRLPDFFPEEIVLGPLEISRMVEGHSNKTILMAWSAAILQVLVSVKSSWRLGRGLVEHELEIHPQEPILGRVIEGRQGLQEEATTNPLISCQ